MKATGFVTEMVTIAFDHFPEKPRQATAVNISNRSGNIQYRALRVPAQVGSDCDNHGRQGFAHCWFPAKIIDMTEPGFICRTCGQTHEGVPLSFAADFPDLYAGKPEPERAVRAVVSSDQCIVDEELFFIRGCLEIPILDSGGDVFLWGLWALVKEEVFNEISESWEEEGRETRRGPFKARLANSLSVYPETLNLKIRMAIQPAGARPLFIVEEEHPLAAGQQHGVSRLEAVELATTLLHIQGPWSKSIQ